MITSQKITAADLTGRPLTLDRWREFEELFGENGACGGCWCMWWRITRKQFEQQAGEGNRQAMKAIVASGEVPGILAYHGGFPVGWCSVAPRDRFPSLNRSPVLKPLDAAPVWSIVCFYIARGYRGRGMTRQLVKAAVDYARANGATIVEAYPTLPRGKKLSQASSFMGLPAVFQKAGFVESARPSAAKIIMRRTFGARRKERSA